MRQAIVYRNGIKAGVLIESARDSYVFRYDDSYYADAKLPAVSLTLPKTQKEYHSQTLFAFFHNMISEGYNRKLQARQLQIDERDYFGLLLATAEYDTIGAVTVKRSPV